MISDNFRSLASATDKLISSPFALISLSGNSRELYLSYLAATCHIIRSSVDLMILALSSCPVEADENFLTYLEKHIEEEREHYQWALEDLQSATAHSELFLARTFRTEVISVPGIAYYQVRNFTPYAVLGYMLALESNPPAVDLVTGLPHKTSLASSAFRTVLVHAEADIEHSAEIYKLIDVMFPQTEAGPAITAIGSTLIMTNVAYAAACRAWMSDSEFQREL